MNRLVATLGCVCLLVSGCAGDDAVAGTSLVPEANDVATMDVDSVGRLVWAERSTGQIRRTSGAVGSQITEDVAQVSVSSDGQRGLLGVAVDPADGELYVSYTDATPEKRLTVAALREQDVRIVWQGPASTDIGNGGSIEFGPDGRLTLAVGDLTRNDLINDPASLNGKMLSLDPDGSAEQVPSQISAGWNNPFAFAYLSDGSLWVADNSPDEAERIARGDLGGIPTTVFQNIGNAAPSGMEAAGEGTFYVCNYVLRSLDLWQTNGTEPPRRVRTLADNCSTAVTAYYQGQVVYASGSDGIRLVGPEADVFGEA